MTKVESITKNEMDSEQIAEQQRLLGIEWASLYALDSDKHSFKDAEIALRNPIVYLQGLHPNQLPKDLTKKWSKLLDLSETIAEVAATDDREWSKDTTGIEKIQNLMFSGNIDSAYRGTISDIIRLSSELFAESTVIVPGNTYYFAGNIRGMSSWINKHRTSE